MYEQRQRLKDLLTMKCEVIENSCIDLTEEPDSLSSEQYFHDVVIPAFEEIRNTFEAGGESVSIDRNANCAFIILETVDVEDKNQEYVKEVKYEIVIIGPIMRSRLYQLGNHGPQGEWPISDEHELTESVEIHEITIESILEDFISTYGAYLKSLRRLHLKEFA